MLKPLIAATAILAIAGSSVVYAQHRYGEGYGQGGPRAERWHQLTPDDLTAYTDARIAALKAGLELTPEQAKNWPAFEQALREMGQLRVERMQARQARRQQAQNPQDGQGTQPPASPFDRMARRADGMAKTSAALKKVAEAGAPLYQSLNDAQKARFSTLARMLQPRHRLAMNDGGWRRDGGYRHDGYGHGYRRFGENDQDPDGGTSDPSQGANHDGGSKL